MTVTQTITNAASVPTFVTFASASRPMKPAKPHASTPTTSVLIHGVLNFEWTVDLIDGLRDRCRVVQIRVRNDADEHGRRQDVEDRADDQRAQDADRHVA